jgi:hypothetical protein
MCTGLPDCLKCWSRGFYREAVLLRYELCSCIAAEKLLTEYGEKATVNIPDAVAALVQTALKRRKPEEP